MLKCENLPSTNSTISGAQSNFCKTSTPLKKLENSGFKDEEILTRVCGEPSADVNILTKSTILWGSTDAKLKVVTFPGVCSFC